MAEKELRPLPYNEAGKIYDYCPVCQKITEQCQYYGHSNKDNRCIKCNGGGDYAYANECNSCYHDQN